MLKLLNIHTKCKLIKYLSTATPEFKTVYKFPYVRGAGIINRMKLYHTILTSMAVPGSAVLNQIGALSQDDVMFTALVGLAGIVPLYSFGYFANKLIGIVYLNEENSLVKFAYLDFWGSRRDVVLPIREIVPFSEVSSTPTDVLYLKVKQFSGKDTMKLCTKYGILDSTGFNKIFSS